MTDIEQQPELKTEMNTATDPDAQPTWDANTDLSGLKGVTIPSTAPSFNEDPRRGRHWSPDNAIQADDDSLRNIFASLDAMPALRHGSGTVPDPMPKAAVEQQPAAEPQQSAQRQPMQQSAAPQAVASQFCSGTAARSDTACGNTAHCRTTGTLLRHRFSGNPGKRSRGSAESAIRR